MTCSVAVVVLISIIFKQNAISNYSTHVISGAHTIYENEQSTHAQMLD